MATMRCSICEKQFETEKSKSLPFCSVRCKQIDLGRWLNEDYGMPTAPSEDELERETEDR